MAIENQDINRTAQSRRKFLTRTGAGAIAAAVGVGGGAQALAQNAPLTPAAASGVLPPGLPPGLPEWTRSLGDPTAGKPYGVPSKYEAMVVRKLYPGLSDPMTNASLTPLQDLDAIITPNGLHFERHHAGFPHVDLDRHRLVVHGMVNRDMIFTVDEIRQFPSESHIYFLECSGNSVFAPPYGKTAAEVAGLVSGALWTGVPLKTILRHAGLKRGASWVVAEGADGAAMTRSLPIEKCLDDVLVAVSQNGERLRPEQGYPVRLFVPGYEGNVSVKWLRRLEVTDKPAYSKEETSKYTDLMTDGRAAKFSFVMEAKSIITSPSGTHKLTRKGTYEMRGLAWSGYGKVRHVDVSCDGGRNWTPAKLDMPVLTKALTSFRAPFDWNGEELMIMSRITDETGYVQPTLAQLIALRGKLGMYHNNAIQPWRVSSSGEVTNGRA